jgi:hypothetical protein
MTVKRARYPMKDNVILMGQLEIIPKLNVEPSELTTYVVQSQHTKLSLLRARGHWHDKEKEGANGSGVCNTSSFSTP